jgi:hypothetical protein
MWRFIMAIEIKKVYKEHFPAVRFIGKCYTDKDRVNGMFGACWEKWFQNGWFGELEKLPQLKNFENGTFGLMGDDGEMGGFQYWIGMMFPEGIKVPEGFEYIDIPEGDVGICWVYGNGDTGEVFKNEQLCFKKLKENGMGDIRLDFKGSEKKWEWYFERYNDPRFMKKDEKGNIILDIGFYIK